nr:unnamed protein product [Callosobruchus chinensis]
MSQVMLCSYGTNDTNNNANDNISEDSIQQPPTIYRCRAPIASLDCMEEFSAGSALSALAGGEPRGGGGGGLPGADVGGSGAMAAAIGTKEQLLLAGLAHTAPAAPLQLARRTTYTPGLRYRNLGKSGLRVSNIGLGTWPTFSPNLTEEQAEQIIVLAVESGINVFDLSEAHSGEILLFF